MSEVSSDAPRTDRPTVAPGVESAGGDVLPAEPKPRHRLVGREMVEGSVSFVAFIVLFAIFGLWLGGQFINVHARLLDVHQNVPILMLSLAALCTLAPGMFDLSIAGVADLTSYLVIGLTVNQRVAFPIILVICVVVGIVVGLVNGWLVEYLHMNPFIATLGVGGICTGLSAVYSSGALITPSTGTPQLPNWFLNVGDYAHKVPSWVVGLGLAVAAVTIFFALDHVRPATWARERWITTKVLGLGVIALLLVFVFRLSQWLSGFSWLILILLVAAFVLWVLLEHTTFGRHVRAIGSNRDAAALVGVPVRRQIIKSFVLGGVLAALAGVALAATQGSASPSAADPDLLPAFAGAFLSTVVLSRGRFTVPGTLIGGVFVVWIGIALIIGGVPSTWTAVVNGAILVLAVALATVMRRRA
jgi:ribose/xylose/arabinose/galactoside ABC-type transport system permease subunit